MIYLFSTQQTSSNASYHRGVLFEDLLRTYLSAMGYDVTLTRRKVSSAEYDIDGTHRVDERRIIGEAKAHKDNIAAEDVQAFVGKSVRFLKPGGASAIFLSVSPLTPEAEDFLEGTVRETDYNITSKVGLGLESDIRRTLSLPSRDTVAIRTQSLIPVEHAQHLLHTDKGSFIVAVGAGAGGGFDDRFALVALDGNVVEDKHFLALLQQSIPALQQLQAIHSAKATVTELATIQAREVPAGLITAADWLDYRRPAGGNYFLGRDVPIAKARSIVREATAGTIVEIKSRSGVGKSSLLAVLAEQWTADSFLVELHDARDVQSSDDVLRLVQRFIGPEILIEGFESIPAALTKLDRQRPGSVFIVDQFESTFQSPEVFAAYEYVAMCIARAETRCAMVYSRKDDLLTTHDDLVVKLDRLRELAQSIALDDFSLEEASALVNKIAQANSKRRVSSAVLQQVLEFAEGFPWLIKRTMAHVVSIKGSAVQLQELFSTGLHLEDLFEEELAELDEHERGYLTRIAGVVPATYQIIARRFEDDPLLHRMLEKLTTRKILRLSAGTYDTYSDVFKDFLLYGRLPEQSHSQIIRMGLVPVMQRFRALKGRNKIEVDSLAHEWGKPQTGIYNILRDMRLAGLVVRTPGGWEVPLVVRQFELQGRLGEFVRQSVLRNRLVFDLINEVEKSGGMTKKDVVTWLRARSHFVRVKDDVWVAYANTLIDWVARLQLVQVHNELLTPAIRDREAVHVSLGNLELAGRGKRPPKSDFIPQCPLSTTRKVLVLARQKPLSKIGLNKSANAAREDLLRLGALSLNDEGLAVAAWTPEEFDSRVGSLLGSKPYLAYWALLKAGVRWAPAIAEAFGVESLAPATREFIGKRLANWGRAYGHLPARLPAKRDTDSDSLALEF